MDVVISFIAEHFGLAVTILVAVLVGFIFLIWWAAGIWHKFKNLPCESHADKIKDCEKATEKVNHLQCSKIEHLVEAQEHRLRATENALSRIEGLIGGLYKLQSKAFESDFSFDIADVSKKQSPRSLNKYGLQIFNEIQGQKFLEENKSLFFDSIDKFTPKTALDVETLSYSVLRLTCDNDCFNGLKNWVYNAPTMEIIGDDGTVKKKDVTFETILFILSIPLRDMYLEAHPGLLG